VATRKNQNHEKNNSEFSEDRFHDLTTSVLHQAKKCGATAVEVDATLSLGFSINVRKSQIETIEHCNGKTLGVTVYFGCQTGSATTSDLSAQAVHTTVEKACHIARFTSEDSFVGLADPELMAYNYPDLDLYHPWQISVEEAIDLARNAEAVGLSHDKRLTNSEGAALNSFKTFNIYANSHGFCGTTASTKHSFNCAFIAEQNNEMQRDYHYTVAHDPNDLENVVYVAKEAAKRTINRLNARRITTRSCPIIFSAETASSLIGSFIRAIHGTNIYRKTSFLLNQLHKPVLAKHINIEENPLIPKALGSTAFDAEGVKVCRNDIVIDGVLQRYALDSYSARKLKMKTTGNAGGVHNVTIKPGNLGLDRLLRKMGTGLLVTELMGDGINIVTGDYSRGVFGYWIENGTIQYPVIGATIASNLKDMLLNIVDVGNDVDNRSSILTGSILLENMAVAGNQVS